jgi:hypothetical protein
MTRGAAGVWLTVASLGFWLSWLLMPGVGVTDAARIFELVGSHRAEVLASVVVQLLSAAAYLPGAFALAIAEPPARAIRTGCVLLAIGAAGSAADAIFHLVAFEMTAPGNPEGALVGVMRRLQGPDLALLLPFVAAFFAGHAVLATAVRRRGTAGRLAFLCVLLAPVAAIAGARAARAGVVPKRGVGLVFLGLLCASLIAVAFASGGDREHRRPAAG